MKFFPSKNKFMKVVAVSLVTVIAYETAALPMAQASMLVKPLTRPHSMATAQKAHVFRLPPSVGSVIDVYAPSKASRMVFHIQDVHGNVPAQTNLAEIVSLLERQAAKQNKNLIVAVEGASGLLDSDSIAKLPNQKAKEDVAAGLLRAGYMWGEEMAAVTHAPGRIQLVGIESPLLYKANLKARNSSRMAREGVLKTLKGTRSQLTKLIPHNFNAILAELESKRVAVEENRSSLTEYVQYLKTISPEATMRYPNVARMAALSSQEYGIEFDKVEKEAQLLLQDVMSKQSESGMDKILIDTQALKEGRISPLSYYANLLSQSQRKFSSIERYVDYLRVSGSIDSDSLFEEVLAAESEVAQRLIRHPVALELYRHILWVQQQERFFSLTMIPEEWNAQKKVSAGLIESQHAAINNFIREQAEDLGYRLAPLPLDSLLLSQGFEGANGFYSAAESRDQSMAENLLKILKKADSESSIVAFVAGGFHTPGMTKQLRDSGVAYEVIRPELETEIKLSQERTFPDYQAQFLRRSGALATPESTKSVGAMVLGAPSVAALGDKGFQLSELSLNSPVAWAFLLSAVAMFSYIGWYVRRHPVNESQYHEDLADAYLKKRVPVPVPTLLRQDVSADLDLDPLSVEQTHLEWRANYETAALKQFSDWKAAEDRGETGGKVLSLTLMSDEITPDLDVIKARIIEVKKANDEMEAAGYGRPFVHGFVTNSKDHPSILAFLEKNRYFGALPYEIVWIFSDPSGYAIGASVEDAQMQISLDQSKPMEDRFFKNPEDIDAALRFAQKNQGIVLYDMGLQPDGRNSLVEGLLTKKGEASEPVIVTLRRLGIENIWMNGPGSKATLGRDWLQIFGMKILEGKKAAVEISRDPINAQRDSSMILDFDHAIGQLLGPKYIDALNHPRPGYRNHFLESFVPELEGKMNPAPQYQIVKNDKGQFVVVVIFESSPWGIQEGYEPESIAFAKTARRANALEYIVSPTVELFGALRPNGSTERLIASEGASSAQTFASSFMMLGLLNWNGSDSFVTGSLGWFTALLLVIGFVLFETRSRRLLKKTPLPFAFPPPQDSSISIRDSLLQGWDEITRLYWAVLLNAYRKPGIPDTLMLDPNGIPQPETFAAPNIQPSAVNREKTYPMLHVVDKPILDPQGYSRGENNLMLTWRSVDPGLDEHQRPGGPILWEMLKGLRQNQGPFPLGPNHLNMRRFINVQTFMADGTLRVKKLELTLSEIKLIELIGLREEFENMDLSITGTRDAQEFYKQLLKQTYLPHLLDERVADKKTYAQVLEKRGINLIYEVMDEPSVVKLKEKSVSVDMPMDGMSKIIFRLFHRSMRDEGKGRGSSDFVRPRIDYFSDENDQNARPDKAIVERMLKEKIPIIAVATPRTGADWDSSIFAVRWATDTDGKPVGLFHSMDPSRAYDQAEAFANLGLEGGAGTPGKQLVSTRQIYVNALLIGDILADIRKLIKEEAANDRIYSPLEIDFRMATIFGPSVTRQINTENGSTSLGVAPETILFNLQNYFLTHRNNKRVKAILESKGVPRLLEIINASRDHFAPHRNARDELILDQFYVRSERDGRLSLRDPSMPLPMLSFISGTGNARPTNGWAPGNPWEKFGSLRPLFINASFHGARRVGFVGEPVKAHGLHFLGNVEVVNNFSGAKTTIFDLESALRLALSQQEPEEEVPGPRLAFQNDRLVVENVRVVINRDGSLTLEPLPKFGSVKSPSPIYSISYKVPMAIGWVSALVAATLAFSYQNSLHTVAFALIASALVSTVGFVPGFYARGVLKNSGDLAFVNFSLEDFLENDALRDRLKVIRPTLDRVEKFSREHRLDFSEVRIVSGLLGQVQDKKLTIGIVALRNPLLLELVLAHESVHLGRWQFKSDSRLAWVANEVVAWVWGLTSFVLGLLINKEKISGDNPDSSFADTVMPPLVAHQGENVRKFQQDFAALLDKNETNQMSGPQYMVIDLAGFDDFTDEDRRGILSSVHAFFNARKNTDPVNIVFYDRTYREAGVEYFRAISSSIRDVAPNVTVNFTAVQGTDIRHVLASVGLDKVTDENSFVLSKNVDAGYFGAYIVSVDSPLDVAIRTFAYGRYSKELAAEMASELSSLLQKYFPALKNGHFTDRILSAMLAGIMA